MSKPIPIFNSTEEALLFGKIMSPTMAKQLKKAHAHYTKVACSLLKKDLFDTAMVIATKGQFYREAVEVYSKR